RGPDRGTPTRSRRRIRRWCSSASTFGKVRGAASSDRQPRSDGSPPGEPAPRQRLEPRLRRKRVTVKYNVIQYSFRPNLGQATRMLQPQELVVAKLLPTIRARLARELLRTHKMKQIDVAHSMGITQAAVSHYNTQSRGVDRKWSASSRRSSRSSTASRRASREA